MTGRFAIASLFAVALGASAFAQTLPSATERSGMEPAALTQMTKDAPSSDVARKAWFGQAVGTILSGEAVEGRSSTTAPGAH